MKNYLPHFIIAIAIIIFGFIISNAYIYKFTSTETIVVTGLAEKDFTSDLIVWKGSFTRTGLDLKEVYAQIKQDEASIKNYLKEKGLPDSSVIFSSFDVLKNYQSKYAENGTITGNIFTGYTLTGEVKIESMNLPLVEKISREVTELLQKGIEFNSQKPSFYYTKLHDLKIDLLANASKDAKLRAETIAKNSGTNINSLKRATSGVFQITGKNDNEEYSYGGSFNTTSKFKTASITIRTEYLCK
ncbi:MAG TPA: SIMPL domain-containing protein [Chitinophagaceae bacterium]|nr:SIMPL domain-containing protein [Chitinophagaceae bacterium]MCC6634320.1 SIMPL domain-containing protein [Chitinophagaceae bacterium]HMZ46566.1 SIMPL domain-containing protein [Chitinophagaceae bacterium]HNE92840.1 SIMPL domain-containing protein [Chitinophagaceae bacterium]HNF30276.1 SIMPL domain-containing protein [Chitinophagaceae bacterium]